MRVRNSISAEAVPLDSDETLVDQLIVLSGARPVDRIMVTGHRKLDVFLGLCRRGFLKATCRTAAECPHTADNSADSLWIVETETAAELRTLVVRCARDLRKGGTLVVSMDSPAAAEGALLLGAVLTRCGFTPIRRMISTGRVLLLCEKRATASNVLAA